MTTVNFVLGFPLEPVRMSVVRYHELVAAGAFTEHDAVELLDGVVVEKIYKNPPHRLVTRKCDLVLSKLCPDGWHVQTTGQPAELWNSKPVHRLPSLWHRRSGAADD